MRGRFGSAVRRVRMPRTEEKRITKSEFSRAEDALNTERGVTTFQSP